MLYVNLKESKLSRIALGTWINVAGKVTDAENQKILNACIETGVNVIDTAASYEESAAETKLGEWINAPLRKKIFISTKIFPAEGLHRQALRVALEGCLRRLKTEYVDMLFLHRHDVTASAEEIVSAFGDFLKEGKILNWGVSRWPIVALSTLIQECIRQGVTPPSAVQEPHNLAFPLPPDMAEFAKLNKLALFLYSPLARGVLSAKYRQAVAPSGSRGADQRYVKTLGGLDKQQHSSVDRLIELSLRHGLSPAQLAYLYVLQSQPESIMLCGFSQLAQLKDAEMSLQYMATEIEYD